MTEPEAKELEEILNGIKFVEVVSSGADPPAVWVLCRVGRKDNKTWAKILETALLAIEDVQDDSWWVNLDVAKKYFLKGRRMVYGWVLTLSSSHLDLATHKLGRALSPFFSRTIDKENMRAELKKDRKLHHPPPRRAKGVPLRYIPKEEEHRSVRTLEADVRGNPIVPEEHKVLEQPMAGLEADLDMNAPTDGKGAFGMFSKSAFRAPSSKSGKVGAAPNRKDT
jgi:hypothetical protein